MGVGEVIDREGYQILFRTALGGFVIMVILALVVAHVADHQGEVIRDQQVYIDAGCQGRYQGEQ